MFPFTNRSVASVCAFALLTAVGCTDDFTPGGDSNPNEDTGERRDTRIVDDRGTGADTGEPPVDDAGGACRDVPVALPMDGKHYGTTYRELNVAWFQWILSQPRIGNPGFDPTGANCASGQSGDVWFLAGSFNQTLVERTCTIPSGKAIFFPILNSFTSCYFGDGNCTEKDLPPELEAHLDGVIDMFATIDGCDVGDPVDYRVHATEFSVTLPEGNVFEAFGSPIDGFVGDLYGEWVQLEWVGRIRDVASFASVEQLRDQLRRDRAQAQTILAAATVRAGAVT